MASPRSISSDYQIAEIKMSGWMAEEGITYARRCT